jgi:hypothetical protein
MKPFLLTLLLATCAVTAQGQTIKTLGYNTTNGNVVYTGTNVLTFTNTNGNEGVKFNKIGIENGIFLYDQATVSFDGEAYFNTISFQTTNDASGTRANLSLGLPALTNTSNLTMMRELAGSTNTNEPFSGSISVVGTNNTNTLVFSNGILLSQ